jgi:hypothetical protein
LEGKGSFFNIVLLFILAFLSLTLAALAGYVFIAGGGSSKASTVIVTQAPEVKVPTDAELTEYPLLTEKTMFNLKNTDFTSDPNTAVISVLQVTISLDYLNKPNAKKSSIKDPVAKLDLYKNKILELINTYFMGMTREEAFQLETKEKANKELTIKINDLLNANEDKKFNIVYGVTFPYWLAT